MLLLEFAITADEVFAWWKFTWGGYWFYLCFQLFSNDGISFYFSDIAVPCVSLSDLSMRECLGHPASLLLWTAGTLPSSVLPFSFFFLRDSFGDLSRFSTKVEEWIVLWSILPWFFPVQAHRYAVKSVRAITASDWFPRIFKSLWLWEVCFCPPACF